MSRATPPEGARFGGRWARPVMPLERSKDFKNSTRRLGPRLRPEAGSASPRCSSSRSRSVTLFVLAPRSSAHATNVIVDGVLRARDRLHQAAPDPARRARVYVVVRGASCVQSYLLAGVVQRAMYRCASDVEDKLNRMPLRYVDQQPRGDMLEPGHERHRQPRAEPAADAEPAAHVVADDRRRADHDDHDLAAARAGRAGHHSGVDRHDEGDRRSARRASS